MRVDRRAVLASLAGAVLLAVASPVLADPKKGRRASAVDIDTVARTVWGEARGEDWRGKVAVVWVLMNRAAHARAYMIRYKAKRHALYGDGTLASAATMPWQFSVWNARDPNRKKLKTAHKTKPWAECLAAVHAVLDGLETDQTGGATHYCHTKSRPLWAKGVTPTTFVGNHKFYLLVN